MEATHLFEGHIYVLSNTAVARNPLFNDVSYCKRFLEKMNFYLSELCEILHYNIDDNQYQIIVRIFDRSKICEYYRNKYSAMELKEHEIPFTTHIISQAMANLQASTAIHFNRKEGRFGALFARRFQRVLVKSKRELDGWFDNFNKMRKMFRQRGKWAYRNIKRKEWTSQTKQLKQRSGLYYCVGRSSNHPVLNNFKRMNEIELQGQFNILPPKNLYELFSKLEIYFYFKKAKF